MEIALPIYVSCHVANSIASVARLGTQDFATDQRRKQRGQPHDHEQPSPKDVVICQQLAPRLMHDIVKESKFKQVAEDEPEKPSSSPSRTVAIMAAPPISVTSLPINSWSFASSIVSPYFRGVEAAPSRYHPFFSMHGKRLPGAATGYGVGVVVPFFSS